jgi:hypothetical protein
LFALAVCQFDVTKEIRPTPRAPQNTAVETAISGALIGSSAFNFIVILAVSIIRQGEHLQHATEEVFELTFYGQLEANAEPPLWIRRANKNNH